MAFVKAMRRHRLVYSTNSPTFSAWISYLQASCVLSAPCNAFSSLVLQELKDNKAKKGGLKSTPAPSRKKYQSLIPFRCIFEFISPFLRCHWKVCLKTTVFFRRACQRTKNAGSHKNFITKYSYERSKDIILI